MNQIATSLLIPTYELILERLLRLDKEASVRLRPTFKSGPMRWYVYMGSVVMGGLTSGGFCSVDPHECSGSTPQKALLNTWNEVLRQSRGQGFFLRFDCNPKDIIPGNRPQVWVRWSEKKDDWEDVPVTPEALAVHRIPPERILPYREHTWMQAFS